MEQLAPAVLKDWADYTGCAERGCRLIGGYDEVQHAWVWEHNESNGIFQHDVAHAVTRWISSEHGEGR